MTNQLKLNKRISTPVGILIIVVFALLVGGGLCWYFSKEKVEILEVKILEVEVPEIEKSEEEFKVYKTKEECETKENKENCKCSFLQCDYVPKGIQFEEACGKNFRKGWRCMSSI